MAALGVPRRSGRRRPARGPCAVPLSTGQDKPFTGGSGEITGDEISSRVEQRRLWRGGISAVRLVPLARVARGR